MFFPGELLWISADPSLQGDPVLGDEEQLRFLPTRFTVGGLAIDRKGAECTSLACPKCHLIIPRVLLNTDSLFLSIIGSPGSGKSNLLAAMTWHVRSLLKKFSVLFTDSDPETNRVLNGYVDRLFRNSNSNELVRLEKNDVTDDLYRLVQEGGRSVRYPQPFIFDISSLQAMEGGSTVTRALRALCLYDNSGEHFLSSSQTDHGPVTGHLGLSRALLFLFDPTQHPKFREACRDLTDDPQMGRYAKTYRQDEILLEVGKRIRSKTNLGEHEQSKQPLIIVMTKYDAWYRLLGELKLKNNWAIAGAGSANPMLDLSAIRKISHLLQRILVDNHAGEIIDAANKLSREVIFLPVSALGQSPEEFSGDLLIRPRSIKPLGVEIPLLYALYRSIKQLIPAIEPNQPRVLWQDQGTAREKSAAQRTPAVDAGSPPSSKTGGRATSRAGGPIDVREVPHQERAIDVRESSDERAIKVREGADEERDTDGPDSISLKETGS